MKAILVLALVAWGASAPAAAQTGASTPPPAETKAKKPKQECRTEQVTGRRIADQVCHTAEEWAAIDQANQQQADEDNRRLQNLGRSSAALGMGTGAPGPR